MSDELRTYRIQDDNSSWTIESRPSTYLADARASVLDGDWFSDDGKWTVHWEGRVTCEDGTDERLEVAIDPPTPPCRKGQEHDWQAPHPIVGGLRDNPGVLGHGGGVLIHEVCARCGRQRHTNTWAQDSRGRQGLQSVRYAPATDETLDWVASEASE
jgi:hypothetical protein